MPEEVPQGKKPSFFDNVKEVIYGMASHDMSRYAVRTRASMEHLFILITMGDRWTDRIRQVDSLTSASTHTFAMIAEHTLGMRRPSLVVAAPAPHQSHEKAWKDLVGTRTTIRRSSFHGVVTSVRPYAMAA